MKLQNRLQARYRIGFVLWLILVILFISFLSSCSVFKHVQKERVKIDSVSVSERDSLSFSFKDSAFKKEIIETEEGSIEVEFDVSDTNVGNMDTTRIPISADDYFVVKGKVKKVTVKSKKVEAKKDSAGKKEAVIVQTQERDSVHKKADVKTYEKKKASFNFTPVILACAGVFFILFAYRRYKNKKPLIE